MILFSGVSIANRAGGSASGLAMQAPALIAVPFDVVLLASAPAFVTDTIACEVWLRTLAPPFTQPFATVGRPPMTAPSTGVALAEGVSSTPVADDLTLLDERRGVVYHLIQTGAVAVAALLDGGTETADAAVAALCARYSITAQTARRDVAQLLDALLAHRLVIRS